MCKNSGNNVNTVLPENTVQGELHQTKEITGKASKGNDGKHLTYLIVELGLKQRWHKQYVNIIYSDKGCKWKKWQGKRERKGNWHFNLGLFNPSLVFLYDWV